MDLSLLGFSGLSKVYNIHPAFVHFPIALFPSAFLFYVLAFLFKNKNLFVAGRATLYLSVGGTLLAFFTGLQAETSIPHNQTIHDLMQTHKAIGTLLLGLALVLTLWSFWQSEQKPKGLWAFLLGLGFASYLALQNGDLGGRMVFQEGAGVKPAVAAITGSMKEEKKGEPTKRTHDHKHHGHHHH